MTTSEPQFLSEIQVKIKCFACKGSGEQDMHRSCGTGQEPCWRCEGSGFDVVSLEKAVLDLVQSRLADMMKVAIGG
jgi:DnaJ-class molecular chaperone